MTPAERWLRERAPQAPTGLLAAMIEALPVEGAEVPEALAQGALALYARVLRGSGGREDALPLLAADALLTHAFEAQAEADATSVEAFAVRWGGALGALA